MGIIPSASWLFPEEQEDVVRRLYRWGLLKFDNGRNLPLKKEGGKTDIYIDLRGARGIPEAIKFLSGLFRRPLLSLEVSRFVEVPDSISCLAGPLAVSTGIPYLTIREQAKEGRFSDAKVIGRPVSGESVCILDDVITGGQSKVAPHQKCLELGLHNRALVVLVDRKEGWQEYLRNQGVKIPVWAGMTLHDVRRHLIQTLGVMQRCDPEVEAKNPIIVALDGKNWDSILPIIDELRTTGCIWKVNDMLSAYGIFNLIPDLLVYGRVMVDLKNHDIPNTVTNTCQRLRPYLPWAVTIHASGGFHMISAAKKALKGIPTKVLAVTVLTSLGEDGAKVIYNRRLIEQVLHLARIARDAGADGFVCSPQEVSVLREIYPKATLVTPGIRSLGVGENDQERIATPKVAIENGANHIVMGRQILGSDDPVAEVKRLLRQELQINI